MRRKSLTFRVTRVKPCSGTKHPARVSDDLYFPHYLFIMAKRTAMTFRRVPLRSDAAGDARVRGSVDARLALVAELSLAAWRATGKPFPSYDRATLPVRRARLGERRDRD